MLMPILTVGAVTADKTRRGEDAAADARTPPPAIRISAGQSEVVLKILATLNRHLVGAEVVPRDALIRLLETVSKALSFPPLPQESLRDFTRRLSAFIETLSPAARAVLEKQLTQRSFAMSVRILVEALKTSTVAQVPGGGGPVRSETQSPVADPKVNGGRPALPDMRTPMGPALQSFAAASAALVPPAQLQAALKAAFGNEDIRPAQAAGDETDGDGHAVAAAPRQSEAAVKQPTADARTASPQSASPMQRPSDAMPLLRAAIAFLATSPEALARILTIASGQIDSRLMDVITEMLGFDPLDDISRPADGTPAAEHGREDAASPSSARPAAKDGLHQAEPENRYDGSETWPLAKPRLDAEVRMANAAKAAENATVLPEDDVIQEASQGGALSTSTHSTRDDHRQPDRMLSQALKALFSLPMSGAATEASQNLLVALMEDAADAFADTLFAEIARAEQQQGTEKARFPDSVPDVETASTKMEAETLTSLREPVARQEDQRASILSVHLDTEDVAVAPQLLHRPDVVPMREGIPFAVMGYPLSSTGAAEVDEEERPIFFNNGSDEDEDEGNQSEDAGEEPAAEEGAVEGEDEEIAPPDPYDIYTRMGGLG